VVAYDARADSESQISNLKFHNLDFERKLLAYIVPREANAPDASELRNFLRKTLPEFMMPSAFVTLERLALLPNGKVDRRSLPAPSGAAVASAKKVRAPRTEGEKIVANVWRELLRLERIGVDDDFFELGGHSLLAATLVLRLGAAFDREISLRDFLDRPTIAAVAAKLAGASDDENGNALPAILPMSLSGELPLSLAQEQFLKLDELISGAAFLHLPYAYRLSGRLDLAAVRQSLQTIVDRHAVLRSVFKESRGRRVQVIRRRHKAACPLSDLSALAAERQRTALARLSRQDADRPFDLAKGAPFRFTLIRLSERRHVLFVTLHHIIADQSSLRLFRAELARLYQAFAQGWPAPLSDPPIQFADFTRWQAALLESGELNGQIEYWQEALAGATPALEFHHGRKRPPTVSARTARRTTELDGALFAEVRALARQRKSTPFLILLAALDVWLYRSTGCRDLRIGTLVANRGRRGTEGLIGYFVNAVVLRARLAPRMTFTELIEQARAATLGAFAHQDLPIEALARARQQKKRRRQSSLYQVMLNYRRFDFKSQKVAGLTIASFSENERAAIPEIAFTSADLTFDIREASTKLTVSVNVKIDLFEEAALNSMLASFAAVVQQAVALPERRLANFVVPILKK
jgi:acyl carrier protein